MRSGNLRNGCVSSLTFALSKRVLYAFRNENVANADDTYCRVENSLD